MDIWRLKSSGVCDAGLMYLFDDVDERHLGIVQLLVEVTSQQNDGIFQFAFAALDRMVAEIADHDRGADRNGGNQQNAANNQPANWIAPARQFAVGQNAIVDLSFPPTEFLLFFSIFFSPPEKHKIRAWSPR